MAKYKVIEKSYIGMRLVEPGEIVDVEFKDGGKAGPNLELVKSKKSAVAAGEVEGDASGDLS